MNIKILQSTIKDWKIIQKLNNQVFESDSKNDSDLDLAWPFTKEAVKYYKEVAKNILGKCLIAYCDNKPAGYINLVKKDFGYLKSKYAEIDYIGVSPEYRSQGIGKKLIDAAAEWAKEVGATKFYVSAYWKNAQGINFYKKNGFYEIGLEMGKNLLI